MSIWYMCIGVRHLTCVHQRVGLGVSLRLSFLWLLGIPAQVTGLPQQVQLSSESSRWLRQHLSTQLLFSFSRVSPTPVLYVWVCMYVCESSFSKQLFTPFSCFSSLDPGSGISFFGFQLYLVKLPLENVPFSAHTQPTLLIICHPNKEQFHIVLFYFAFVPVNWLAFVLAFS